MAANLIIQAKFMHKRKLGYIHTYNRVLTQILKLKWVVRIDFLRFLSLKQFIVLQVDYNNNNKKTISTAKSYFKNMFLHPYITAGIILPIT